MNIFNFFWTASNSKTEISSNDYLDKFIRYTKPEDLKYTYEKAWESKQFEIENYWKCAHYFWLFQAAAFAAYFVAVSHTEVLYAVIAIGFITGLAWVLTNIGSKQWQENWEMHVNKLEDYVTGPLYKIGTNSRTYSVSKINLLVSLFVTIVWVFLAILFFVDNVTLQPTQNSKPWWFVILMTAVAALAAWAMLFGYGRSTNKFKDKKFYWYYNETPENKDDFMDDKDVKILHEKNEMLRTVGLYSFLFFAAACAVLVIRQFDCLAWVMLIGFIPFIAFACSCMCFQKFKEKPENK
ncbi:MAG: hypothetical protein Ta2A_01620 [Treponemataceae bacterium]|nr:MAG: hypothetical protein Ta2A_01620 [Treponemataceae bacterium]